MSTNGTQNGISFTKAYATSDGKTFSDIGDAKRHELRLVLSDWDGTKILTKESADSVIDALLAKPETIINILSTTEKSRPKARKANGATRKPRNSTPATT